MRFRIIATHVSKEDCCMAGVEGRVALVTGAAQGIGRAIALKLAKGGAAVAVADIMEDKLAEVVNEITSAGGQAAGFKMNVADEDNVKRVVKDAVAQFGRLEILVNNAGITRDQLIMRMKRSEWDLVVSINLTGVFLCTQAAVPVMMKQRWGRIINISSINGQQGQAGQANYSATKAGVIGLTMATAREVASRNITVNAIAPGFIETAMTQVLSAEVREGMLKAVPLGRPGTPEDIANAASFLASEEAGYITGHVMKVNGGMLMG
ncbi:MAG: 3-oxoacyl-[acyl-carrier-protein] reductase [Terriglobales bacterium]